jgi:hypothetical protein
MLVLIASADEHADEAAARLAGAARDGGLLVAAILVCGDDASAARSDVLASVRDAADLVMVVREAEDVRAIVAALR